MENKDQSPLPQQEGPEAAGAAEAAPQAPEISGPPAPETSAAPVEERPPETPAAAPAEKQPAQAPGEAPDRLRGRDRGGPGGRPPQERRPGPPGRPDRGPGPRPQQGQGKEGRGPGQRPPRQPWTKNDFLARAVEGGIDRQFIDTALEFARSIGPNLNPAQVRAVYGEVLRQEISGLDPARLLLLKPRLAYLAAKAGRPELREFRSVLERGVEKVCAEGIADGERRSRLERFSRGLEAILAYHKVYER